jgi:hypothetical protein
MLGDQWQSGVLIGWIAINALLAYRAYHLRKRRVATVSDSTDDGGLVDADDGGLVDADDGTVECPDCGAANELGYRFCRSCVSELPGTRGFDRDADGTLGRLTR